MQTSCAGGRRSWASSGPDAACTITGCWNAAQSLPLPLLPSPAEASEGDAAGDAAGDTIPALLAAAAGDELLAAAAAATGDELLVPLAAAAGDALLGALAAAAGNALLAGAGAGACPAGAASDGTTEDALAMKRARSNSGSHFMTASSMVTTAPGMGASGEARLTLE